MHRWPPPRHASGASHRSVGVAALRTTFDSVDADPAPRSVVDEVARLYALEPAEFVAARNVTAKVWKKSGRRDDALTIAALRRPSVIEHALNRVAHGDPDAVRAWAGAAAAAEAAQAAAIGGADAGDLREALADLRAATAGLADAATDALGDASKRNDILALLRGMAPSGIAQAQAGVLGSAVLAAAELFAGAPTLPDRPRPTLGPALGPALRPALRPAPRPALWPVRSRDADGDDPMAAASEPCDPPVDLAAVRRGALEVERATRQTAVDEAEHQLAASRTMLDAARARVEDAERVHAQARAALLATTSANVDTPTVPNPAAT